MKIAHLIAYCLSGFIKVYTGVHTRWLGESVDRKTACVYYANHRSHGDFLLIWASLPEHRRVKTRPVAAGDYWLKGVIRQYVINQVFRGVLINRQSGRAAESIDRMSEVLNANESLIIFPEGTRNSDENLLPFKGGIFHLACQHPNVQFIPVWIENIGRVMPKGSLMPLPLLCAITFGRPLVHVVNEGKAQFLERASKALLELAPQKE